MKLDSDQIKNLAWLSRLRTEDVEKLSGDLTQILDYVEQIQSVDTSGVSPMAWVGGEENVFRTDEVTNSATAERRAELIGNESGEIRVPGIFEESENA